MNRCYLKSFISYENGLSNSIGFSRKIASSPITIDFKKNSSGRKELY